MENPFATLLVRTAPVLSSEPVDSTDTAASIDLKNGSENNSALGNSNIINVSSGSRTPLKSQTPGKISRNSCAASTPTNRGSESSGAAHTPSKMSRFSCTISTPTNRGSESSTSVRKLSTTGKLNAPSVSWQQSPARSVPRSAGKGCDVATPGKRMAKGAAAVPSSYGQSKASPSYTNSPGLSPRSGGAGQGPSRQTPSASTSAPPSPMPFAALIFSSSLATAASPEPMVNHQPMCRTLDAALRQSLGVPDEHISSLPQDALLDRKERMRQSLLRIRSSVTAEELEDVPEGDTVFDELRKLADATCVTQPEDATVASQQEEKEDAANKPRRESMVLDQALVRQMLPRKVCLPLREGKPVPPEAFSDVAIFFSDVVGFTTISAGVPPIQVLQLLNTLFTVMDYCCSLFPL